MFWVIAILVIAVIVFGTAPLIRYQLETNLSQTLAQTVTIEQVRLNVFRGQIGVDGMRMGTTKLDSVDVDIELIPLFSRQINIETLELVGLSLPIKVHDGQVIVAGVELRESEANEPVGTQTPWLLNIANASIRESEFEVGFNESRHDLALNTLEIGPVSSMGDFKADILLDGLLDAASVNADGSMSFTNSFSESEWSLSVEGQDIQLANYGAILEQPGLQGTLKFKQRVEGSLKDGVPMVQADGELNLTSVALDQLIELADFSFDGQVSIDESAGYAVLGNAGASGLELFELGEVASVNLKALQVSPNEISADELLISGLRLALERDEQGKLILPDQLLMRDAEAVEEGVKPKGLSQENADWKVSVSAIQVTGGQFEFIDRSVEPIVDLMLDDINAQATDFSLNELFEFKFDAQHHQASDATLGLRGDLAIATQSGDISINLSGFELHEIAPYMGNGIKSGRMKLASEISVTNGHIKIGNDVVIRNVKIDERATSSGDQMSLSTALFMLKGSDDVIELNVPLETDLDNFEVGMSDIIQTAMLNAARSAAVAYAQYALQPYGTLLFAKDMFGAITKPKFEPVQFELATADLSSDDAAYVSKLGDFLADRPELSVTVCGYAQTSETGVLRTMSLEQGELVETQVIEQAPQGGDVIPTESEVNQLKLLAEQRSMVVRQALLSAGVSEGQLYGCTAAVEAEPGVARVELAL